jgi:hypothetical protein
VGAPVVRESGVRGCPSRPSKRKALTEPDRPVIGYCAWMKCSTFTLTGGPKFGIAVEVSVSVTGS